MAVTNSYVSEFTKSVWHFPAESAKKVGHPVPFPIELPYRCIQLCTAEGEVILDPFMGAGATALAAKKTKRRFVGYEIEKKYCDIAIRRLDGYSKAQGILTLTTEEQNGRTV